MNLECRSCFLNSTISTTKISQPQEKKLLHQKCLIFLRIIKQIMKSIQELKEILLTEEGDYQAFLGVGNCSKHHNSTRRYETAKG